MKQSLLFGLLLAAAVLRAQSPFSLLNDLEGTWYREGRQLATYSDWAFTDEHTMVNRTYTIECGVTKEIGRAELRLDGQASTVTYQATAGVPQTFRLIRLDGDAIIFQNTNADAQPQELAWSFTEHGDLVIRTDAVQSVFYRQYKKALRATMSLRLGANVSTQEAHFQYVDKRYFRPGAGADLAFVCNVRSKGPLGMQFEVGLSQRRMAVAAYWADQDVYYYRRGSYRNIDFYAAFLPEFALGKRRRLALSAGVATTFARKTDFRGVTRILRTNPNVKDPETSFYLGHEASLAGGITWQLPKTVFPAWQPSLYVRGAYGLGYAKIRALSVGVGLRLR